MVLAAVGQICSTTSLAHNLAQCQVLVRKAAAAGAKALFLPEASDYIASSTPESLSLCLPASSSPFVLGLQAAARTHSLAINVGIHEPSSTPSPIAPSSTSQQQDNDPDKKKKKGEKLKNTLIWIDASGKITQRYQKLHLFDISLPSGPTLRESDSVERGPAIQPPFPVPELDGLHLGMLICFDMRFPEPSLSLVSPHRRPSPAQVLLYPSAFTVPTGLAHWEVILRARAIECQSIVIAAAQCGRHNGKRISYGDSIVVGPWGQVLGRLERVEDAKAEQEGQREPQLLIVDLDAESVAKVRREMPLQRRTDVYPEL